ncbi:uncharacterized protein V6R79_022099 [Siganus canaliculatus]
MATASITHSELAAPTLAFEDYSFYTNLSDDELLSLAIERSLTETHLNTSDDNSAATTGPPKDTSPESNGPKPIATNTNPTNSGFHDASAAQITSNYSSSNPANEKPKPPDPKSFDGTVSHFMTGSGKRMMAYRRADGSIVTIVPEPKEKEEPLFTFIRVGDVSTVKKLVMHPGRNLMLPSELGWLAIHQAAWFGQDTCLIVLLSAHPGMINKQTVYGETALLIAVKQEHLGCVHVLLESGANPDITNNDRETPLFIACEKNSAALVAMLLNHGAAVNIHCFQGWTALHEAVCQNNVEICEMLLKAGAKLNLTNIHGISPLFTAAQNGQLGTLRLLLQHGADANTRAADGTTALYEAAKNGHQEVAALLLSKKAYANKPGKTGLLPLHIAAQQGNHSIISMLVRATSKARIHQSGISPIHLAAEHNRDDVLATLIEAGFEVNAQLSEEWSKLYEDRRSTALYFSVINSNIDAVHMLLKAGADPNLDLFRPLMVAARLGCMQTVTLLVEHGADINASIPTHPTTFPAIYMFSMKDLPMFKYLLDHGGNAVSCFNCNYGKRPHPPLNMSQNDMGELNILREAASLTLQRRGVQFCEMISVPSICRWAGPIIDVLLDYVCHVTLCSRLMEHLDSYTDWSVIKDKAGQQLPNR